MDLCNIFGTIVGSFWHEGPLYVFMGIVLVLGRVVLQTSWVALGLIVGFAALMGIIGNAFHMSFHVRGFEMEKYQWYMELRMLHYIHHLGDMKSNLAMVNMGMDGLFGSLQADDPSRKKRDRATGKVVRLSEEDGYPAGLTKEMFDKIRDAAGLQATALGFDIDLDIKPEVRTNATNRGYPTILLRMILLGIALASWYVNENELSALMKQHGPGVPM